MKSIIVAGTGKYVPQKVLHNNDLAAMGIDTNDAWITERTGIKERHIASPEENSVTMALNAAKIALENAKIAPSEVDLIVAATITNDSVMPSVACRIQQGLPGCREAFSFDIVGACSGFVYALSVAQALMQQKRYKTAIVVGSEKLSSIVDWTDRSTCVLFGDGAGAVVLRTQDEPGWGIIDTIEGADGSLGELLTLPPGGKIKMEGKKVFVQAVRVMARAVKDLLERNHIDKDDVALYIPHQANQRIVDAIAKDAGLPIEKIFVNLQRYGNTSAASIPIALSEAADAGRLKRGNLVVLVAFGGGLTWGASLIRWV